MREVWLRREREIARMVLVERFTPEELAERYEVGGETIRQVLKAFGLPLGTEAPDPLPADPIPMTLPFTTYEEDGRTIKRYAPGYALGAIIHPYTARSRN